MKNPKIDPQQQAIMLSMNDMKIIQDNIRIMMATLLKGHGEVALQTVEPLESVLMMDLRPVKKDT